MVQIWPGLFVCKQVTVCPGHIWTTLYVNNDKVVITATKTHWAGKQIFFISQAGLVMLFNTVYGYDKCIQFYNFVMFYLHCRWNTRGRNWMHIRTRGLRKSSNIRAKKPKFQMASFTTQLSFFLSCVCMSHFNYWISWPVFIKPVTKTVPLDFSPTMCFLISFSH